jgi:alpha-tubulin suppressor-like RCC1 family protein
VSAGILPTGVTFDEETGVFTGPEASAWNFKATQIAAGANHTCALTTSGGVKCWGQGGNGPGGTGPGGTGQTSNQSIPVDVVAAGGGITQIAAGSWHACALTSSGGVKCWGNGEQGELGHGDNANQSTPVDVVAAGGGGGNLSGIAQIAAGGWHTCALTNSGGVKCWGEGRFGKLGNGTTSSRNTPEDVVATGGGTGPLSGITQVAAAGSHTCALTTSGGVKCWGYGGWGLLGNGGTGGNLDVTSPVDVCVAASTPGACDGTPLRDVTQIAADSSHTCALTTSGGVKCWGYGRWGRLGNGADDNQSTPVNVLAGGGGGGTLSGITQIDSGGFHTCALTTSGGVKCWGQGYSGQLGNGENLFTQSTPVDVTKSGPQPGFPADLSVTVTDDTGSWTLGRVVLGTK